ncbi:hypothetical protein PybrP1_012604 [[Pythium] brassicae (nom. inval.)]|nr:hypothetical protein PybrP1_012604 [[Pythium] brassicae (nom. inval.)]
MEPTAVLLCDDAAAATAAPRYDVTAASAVAAAGNLLAAPRAVGRNIGSKSTPATPAVSLESASRGSTVTLGKTHSSFLIAAVAENRAREIGICAIDLVAPYELLLWSIIDSHSYAETASLLHAYQPTEILVVEAVKANRINDEIAKRFSGSICRVVPIARKYFECVV